MPPAAEGISWLLSCLRYCKLKQTWRRPVIAFPPSSLASGNTEEISRYYMMIKFRFWPIPIGNLIILKNVCHWLLSPKLRLLSQNTRILGHQRRQTSPNHPKAPKHTWWPATNLLYTILTPPSSYGNPQRNWLPSEISNSVEK